MQKIRTFIGWDAIINFIKSFVSSKTDTEPKYVVGGVATILWVIMILYHLYSRFNIQSELIWANVALIAACFGLDVVSNMKAMTVKGNVASDMVKEDSSTKTNDQATDVLQSQKP